MRQKEKNRREKNGLGKKKRGGDIKKTRQKNCGGKKNRAWQRAENSGQNSAEKGGDKQILYMTGHTEAGGSALLLFRPVGRNFSRQG